MNGLGCRRVSDKQEQHECQQARGERMSGMKSWLQVAGHLIDSYATVRFKWKI